MAALLLATQAVRSIPSKARAPSAFVLSHGPRWLGVALALLLTTRPAHAHTYTALTLHAARCNGRCASLAGSVCVFAYKLLAAGCRYQPVGGGGASVLFTVHASDWRNISTWKASTDMVFPGEARTRVCGRVCFCASVCARLFARVRPAQPFPSRVLWLCRWIDPNPASLAALPAALAGLRHAAGACCAYCSCWFSVVPQRRPLVAWSRASLATPSAAPRVTGWVCCVHRAACQRLRGPTPVARPTPQRRFPRSFPQHGRGLAPT